MSEQKYPDSRYSWYMVVILTFAYIFSFIDRYILGLLIEPIKADLGLTDTQMALLGGAAFSIFYVSVGLPLGYLADRKRRTVILGIGVAVWSLATAASGLARGFWHLFTARMLVGAGEATLGPCAMSMISDSFPREKRGKPIAFYSAALSLGAGIASLVSASILFWAKSVPEITMPLIGVVAPWQFTFIVVGLPGLIIAALLLTLREPPRQRASEDNTEVTFGFAVRYVTKRWKVYGSTVAFATMMIIVAYSQFFYAAMFERTWDWGPEKYALVNGLLLLALGPLTVNIAGIMNDRMYAKGITDAPLIIMIVGALLLVPAGILAPFMPTPELAFLMIGINTIGIATTTATSLTALMNITPAKIRGQTVAFYYMVVSIAGLLLGPTTVGVLSDYVFGNENLFKAAAMVPAIYGIPVLFLIGYARRVYRKEHDALQEA